MHTHTIAGRHTRDDRGHDLAYVQISRCSWCSAKMLCVRRGPLWRPFSRLESSLLWMQEQGFRQTGRACHAQDGLSAIDSLLQLGCASATADADIIYIGKGSLTGHGVKQSEESKEIGLTMIPVLASGGQAVFLNCQSKCKRCEERKDLLGFKEDDFSEGNEKLFKRTSFRFALLGKGRCGSWSICVWEMKWHYSRNWPVTCFFWPCLDVGRQKIIKNPSQQRRKRQSVHGQAFSSSTYMWPNILTSIAPFPHK